MKAFSLRTQHARVLKHTDCQFVIFTTDPTRHSEALGVAGRSLRKRKIQFGFLHLTICR